jgi:DNA-binding response OmpR family regulator
VYGDLGLFNECSAEVKEFPAFQLDVENQCPWRDGVRLPLTPKAFSVLQYLVELITESPSDRREAAASHTG